jgi:hypothetical protein
MAISQGQKNRNPLQHKKTNKQKKKKKKKIKKLKKKKTYRV